MEGLAKMESHWAGQFQGAAAKLRRISAAAPSAAPARNQPSLRISIARGTKITRCGLLRHKEKARPASSGFYFCSSRTARETKKSTSPTSCANQTTRTPASEISVTIARVGFGRGQHQTEAAKAAPCTRRQIVNATGNASQASGLVNTAKYGMRV